MCAGLCTRRPHTPAGVEGINAAMSLDRHGILKPPSRFGGDWPSQATARFQPLSVRPLASSYTFGENDGRAVRAPGFPFRFPVSCVSMNDVKPSGHWPLADLLPPIGGRPVLAPTVTSGGARAYSGRNGAHGGATCDDPLPAPAWKHPWRGGGPPPPPRHQLRVICPRRP